MQITLTRPDDWHLHLRDGDMLKGILPETTRDFGRAIIMPNLIPPVVTSADAAAYRARIQSAMPKAANFTPLMTLYLTEGTAPQDVTLAAKTGTISAVKLYPAGATTNSDSGVKDIENVMPVLERMSEIGLPLCVHGEITDPAVDIFDREAAFIERVLAPLRTRLPELKIIMEHVTTKDGVDYVNSAQNTAATLTTHHLIINRNHLLVGGIKPHYYCLPIAKRESHRLALVEAATSGNPKFFLGTDSAPHTDPNKESACGCAGVFSATNTLPCLAHVFEDAGALGNLEAFTSLNGPAFYGLEPNEGKITLTKQDTPVDFPEKIETPAGPVTVFAPGFPLFWRVA